jgi:hypothetical protein
MLLGLITAIGYRVNGGWLFSSLMLFYPIVYYITFTQPRYRHAIEPEMLLLAAYFVYETVRVFSARFSKRTDPKAARIASMSQNYTRSGATD